MLVHEQLVGTLRGETARLGDRSRTVLRALGAFSAAAHDTWVSKSACRKPAVAALCSRSDNGDHDPSLPGADRHKCQSGII
jgi:hypothetical protein